MGQETNYIVFQCYGNEGIFQECAYALLSLSRLYKKEELANVQIWIYTDKPGWFKALKDCWLPLHYRSIDNNIIKDWRGKINFVHRVKIEVLKDFTRERNGNILYSDTDVVFTHRIDKVWEDITAGQLYMHVMEGIVSNKANPVLTKLDAFLRKDTTLQVNGKPLYDLSMWNAGVLGFNTDRKGLLDQVLSFTDTEYPKFPKHIIEQFAFSVFFQQVGNVKAAAPYILHYWNLKEARSALASFFAYFKEENWDTLTKYSILLQMHVLMQEKTNFFNNRSIMGKLQKKQWLPAIQDWQELIKQL